MKKEGGKEASPSLSRELPKCVWSGKETRKMSLPPPLFQSRLLTFGQRRRRDVVLVPEPVSLLEDLELLPEEAAEGGPHHRAGQGPLGQAADKQVDVVDVGVY